MTDVIKIEPSVTETTKVVDTGVSHKDVALQVKETLEYLDKEVEKRAEAKLEAISDNIEAETKLKELKMEQKLEKEFEKKKAQVEKDMLELESKHADIVGELQDALEESTNTISELEEAQEEKISEARLADMRCYLIHEANHMTSWKVRGDAKVLKQAADIIERLMREEK